MPPIASRRSAPSSWSNAQQGVSSLYFDSSKYATSRQASPSPLPSGLQSPIRLESALHEPSPKSKSDYKRRATFHKHPYTASHRPQLSHNDCPFDSSPNFFQEIPWISALEAAPHERPFSWDISDLSQLTDTNLSVRHITPPRPFSKTETSSPARDETFDNQPPSPFPFPFNTLDRCYSPRPSKSHIRHSQILFRHLMPAYPPRFCRNAQAASSTGERP